MKKSRVRSARAATEVQSHRGPFWSNLHDRVLAGFVQHLDALLPSLPLRNSGSAKFTVEGSPLEFALELRVPPGRPRQSRDRRPRPPRLIPGHTRETHELLSKQLASCPWHGSKVFREAFWEEKLPPKTIQKCFFTPETRALLKTIHPDLRKLHRFIQRFGPK